jgi:hypothetical protein
MAVLSKSGITTGATIQVGHVTQSVDAFTGINQYDITISGSLTTTGSVLVNGKINVNGAITGSAITGSFTGSLSGNATTSTFVASSPQNYMPKGGSFIGPGNLGLIAGSTTLSSGASPLLNPAPLTGKTFQTQFWVTATIASGSASTTPITSTLFIESLSAGTFSIKEIGATSNNDVNFIIVYLS